MTKHDKSIRKADIIGLTLFVFILFGICLACLIIVEEMDSTFSYETEVVVGTVTNYFAYDAYVTIEFNNETRYDIKFGDYDFTVNSNLIVRLTRYNYDGFIIHKHDEQWTVSDIMKLPSLNEE